jgi:excisionase family DNA binding protein
MVGLGRAEEAINCPPIAEAPGAWHPAECVAAYLGMTSPTSVRVIRRWAVEGKIKAGKAGSRWRFRKEDVDRFVQLGARRRA